MRRGPFPWSVDWTHVSRERDPLRASRGGIVDLDLVIDTGISDVDALGRLRVDEREPTAGKCVLPPLGDVLQCLEGVRVRVGGDRQFRLGRAHLDVGREVSD